MLPCEQLKNKLQGIKELKLEFEDVYGPFDPAMEKNAKRALLDQAGEKKDAIEARILELEDGIVFPHIISAEYEHLDGTKEIITIDFEKKLEQYKNFYVEHMIPVPIDFEFRMADVWEDNLDEIEKGIREMGFDEALLIPADLNLEKLASNLTEGYKETRFFSFKEFGKISDLNLQHDRIVMVHRNPTGEIEYHEILKHTLNKSVCAITGLDVDEIKRRIAAEEPLPVKFEITDNTGKEIQISGEGLSLSDYLILQRLHYDVSQTHLDLFLPSVLLQSPVGSNLASIEWDSTFESIVISVFNFDFTHSSARICRTFRKNGVFVNSNS